MWSECRAIQPGKRRDNEQCFQASNSCGEIAWEMRLEVLPHADRNLYFVGSPSWPDRGAGDGLGL